MSEQPEDVTQNRRTLPDEYFDDIYEAHNDPWNFETSSYEAAKYAASLRSLPRPHYDNAFEIGCSIGVLSAQLAGRCGRLLAVDVAEQALARALARCQHLFNVSFKRQRVPQEFPDDTFDLVVVSEVGYYLSTTDLHHLRLLLVNHLRPHAHLLLVHWTPFVPDYPLTGDQVHDFFLEIAAPLGAGDQSPPGASTSNGQELPLRHLRQRLADKYRLDLFERT